MRTPATAEEVVAALKKIDPVHMIPGGFRECALCRRQSPKNEENVRHTADCAWALAMFGRWVDP